MSPSPNSSDPANTFDVVVVGGGGSGLATAVAAAEHGLSVLVLEKQPQLGGTTGIAVGSYTASKTSFQRKAGICDSVDDHAEDAGRFASPEIESRNNDRLRRYFLGQAGETLEWLCQMGLSFHGPSPEPPNRVERMHNVVPGAKAYIATLQVRLFELGGQIDLNRPVEMLLRDDSGQVTGVRAHGDDFYANIGVVLAAGDYANSPQWIRRFKGDSFARVEGINPHACGDGHRLAESVGAQLLNMDITYGPEIRFVAPPGRTFQQLLPAQGLSVRWIGKLLPWIPRPILHRLIRRLLVTWQHPEDALFDDGTLLINQDGERFCHERRSPERELAIASQPGKVAYLLLDQNVAKRYQEWPHFISTAPKIAYAYVSDYLKLRRDIAVAGPLETVAAKRKIPIDRVRRTVAAENDRRQLGGEPPLDDARWVLLGPAQAYFTTTEGGAAINERCEVLDDSNRPIPGLYAVGQNGLGGQVLWGHGLHIAWAITSGRLCGQSLHLAGQNRDGRGERAVDVLGPSLKPES